jgi:hypothetical protein
MKKRTKDTLKDWTIFTILTITTFISIGLLLGNTTPSLKAEQYVYSNENKEKLNNMKYKGPGDTVPPNGTWRKNNDSR